MNENACPQPVSPYGITKLAGERLRGLYYKNFGLPTTSLRYFTVYGPRQRPDMAFHKFFKSILFDEAISICADGLQTRDFTFISDCVAANLAAAEVAEAAGEVFNIGGGSRVVLKEIIDTIERIVDRPIRIDFTEAARGDARHTSADVSKAQKILGYQPQVALEEGLRREWEWIQSLYS
jgi:nucleoside-diphosphate-sugar epimerase